jgi:uncharacterized protein (DUF983 family)
MHRQPSMLTAMGRGLRRRCPKCGEGHLYQGTGWKRFIRIVDRCAACGERLGHIRADDIPAYFTVFLVGHIMLSGLLAIADRQYPEGPQLAVAIPLAAILVYLFLPSIKGAVAARLWALGMASGVVESEARLQPE